MIKGIDYYMLGNGPARETSLLVARSGEFQNEIFETLPFVYRLNKRLISCVWTTRTY